MGVQPRSSRAPLQYVLDVSLLRPTRYKRSAHEQALRNPITILAIWIRWLGGWRHPKLDDPSWTHLRNKNTKYNHLFGLFDSEVDSELVIVPSKQEDLDILGCFKSSQMFPVIFKSTGLHHFNQDNASWVAFWLLSDVMEDPKSLEWLYKGHTLSLICNPVLPQSLEGKIQLQLER